MEYKPSNPADMKGVPDPHRPGDWAALVKNILSSDKHLLFIDWDAASAIPAHLREAYIQSLTQRITAGEIKIQ